MVGKQAPKTHGLPDTVNLTPKEKKAFEFTYAMRKEWEAMTGEKIKPDISAIEDDSKPSGPVSVTSLIHDMTQLAKEMSGGKPLQIPKKEELEKPVTTSEDLTKQLDALEKDKQLAFRGMPKPVGAKSGPVDTEGNTLPTEDEKARQIAVKKKLERDRVMDKKDKAADGKSKQEEEAADSRKRAKQQQQQQPPSLSLGEWDGLDVELLQLGEDDDDVQSPEKKTDDAATKSADAVTTERSEKVTKAATDAGVSPEGTDNPSTDWYNKQHKRLNGVRDKLDDKEKAKALAAKMAAEDKKNAGPEKEATEKRKKKDEMLAAKQKERNAAEKKLSNKDVGHPIDCPAPNDLECLRKRSSELAAKARLDRHIAYDLQRKSALAVSADLPHTKVLNADNAAEQARVVAAVTTRAADLAAQDMERVLAKNAADEKHDKSQAKTDLKVEKKANKIAGEQVKKEASKIEAANKEKIIEKAEEQAKEQAEVIDKQIKKKEEKKEEKKAEKEEKKEKEEEAKKDAEEKKQAKKEKAEAAKKEVQAEKEAVKKAEKEVEAANKKVEDDQAKQDAKAVPVGQKVEPDAAGDSGADDAGKGGGDAGGGDTEVKELGVYARGTTDRNRVGQ